MKAGMVENQRLLLSFENNEVLCTSKTCRVELFLSYAVSREFELGTKVKPVYEARPDKRGYIRTPNQANFSC